MNDFGLQICENISFVFMILVQWLGTDSFMIPRCAKLGATARVTQ